MTIIRKLIRVDGSTMQIPSKRNMEWIRNTIGADGIDTVCLHHMGKPLHVMIVDDTGMIDGKPINKEATNLYWKNCIPGTIHPICGDVIIVPDDDF